ncbi:hypothetical protein VTN00DRAFT_4225 [Thermoascus crustaceus]|uniref:uncharacterized protein n=1 Tax=Thermoascus crustaceus TaxID=5088 RepID=UPI0037445FC1
MATNTVAAPSPAQLALALAIVKLKPANVDIKDHILQIRQHIKSGRDPHLASAPEKHLDSIAFWQQAYEKSESAQSKLLDRIYELEQRNEALLARMKQTSPAEREAPVPASKKRKANDEAVGTTRKRAKTNLGVAAGGGLLGKSYNVLDGFEYLEETTAPFMRQLHALQQALQRRPSRSGIVLAAVDLCKVAEKAVFDVTRETKPATGRSKTTAVLQKHQPDLQSVLHALERAHRLLYQGINKLSATDEGRKDVGQVTYHLVSLFEMILDALQQHCKIKATEATTKPKPKKKQKQATKSKLSKTTPLSDTSLSMDDDSVAMQIARTLATMILSLSSSKTEHRNLLDGYLFVLLNRVGKTLCLFVFRDLQLRPDLRTDATKLPLPAGLRVAGLDDASLRVAESEAKYLVWLLERAVAFVDTFPVPLPPETSGGVQSSAGSASLLSRAKAKLQNTLLRAVFGEDDPLFKDHLNPPKQPDVDRLAHVWASVQCPEKSVPEWFTQEVWRLLGWDVLVKKTSG